MTEEFSLVGKKSPHREKFVIFSVRVAPQGKWEVLDFVIQIWGDNISAHSS